MANKVNRVDPLRDTDLNRCLELFHFAYRAFTAGPDRILEGKGLQRVHHRILYFVGRNPGIAVSGLLGILGVSKQALNAPLRQLLEMKQIEVKSNIVDRRVRELRLTPEGARLEQSLSGLQRKSLAAVFAACGPKTEADWRMVMKEIANGAGQTPHLP